MLAAGNKQKHLFCIFGAYNLVIDGLQITTLRHLKL